MSYQAKRLLEEGLALALADRRLLAEELFASLSEEEDEAFAAELRRRREEAISDPSCMVPWTEIEHNQ